MSEHNQPPETAAPVPDAAPPTAEELAQLRARAAERDQFLDLLQRTRAEFENYQKRNARDRDQERRYALAPLARDLLPVYDNLQRAAAAAQRSGESGPLVQGVRMVLGQILEAFKRHGITPVEALGKPFDPTLHEALTQQPAPGRPPNTVIHVEEEGFLHHDRVLRPAKVVVSAPE